MKCFTKYTPISKNNNKMCIRQASITTRINILIMKQRQTRKPIPKFSVFLWKQYFALLFSDTNRKQLNTKAASGGLHLLYSFIFPNVARQRKMWNLSFAVKISIKNRKSSAASCSDFSWRSLSDCCQTVGGHKAELKAHSNTDMMPFGSSWNPLCCSQAQQKRFDQLEDTDTIVIYIIMMMMIMTI